MSLHAKRSPTWRYALLAGLPIAAVATYGYVQTGSDIELSGLAVFALITGYVAKTNGLEATPVGLRAGLVATTPVALWSLGELVLSVGNFSQPRWFAGVQVLMSVFVFGLVLTVGALVGMLGARIGGWLAERSGHPRDGTPA